MTFKLNYFSVVSILSPYIVCTNRKIKRSQCCSKYCSINIMWKIAVLTYHSVPPHWRSQLTQTEPRDAVHHACRPMLKVGNRR